MKELTSMELKEVQLSILDHFDNFCKHHSLKYSLACGTLLGAIRHGGYIPWDDDIDVYMERNEYDQFINIYSNTDNSNFKLLALENNNEYNLLFAKLTDNRTTLIEDYNIFPIAVNIDIFPLDTIKKKVVKNNKINNKLFILKWLWLAKVHRFSSKTSIIKNGAHLILKIVSAPISIRYLANQINKAAKNNNNTQHQYLFELSMNSTYSKGFEKQSFEQTIDVEFEGKLYKAMAGYDEYLTSSFGEYMKLPPIEERISHHNFKAYWI